MSDYLYIDKGESMPLKKIELHDDGKHFTELVVHLGWDVRPTTDGPPFDLNACVFPLTSNDVVPTGRFCVYYNNLVSPDGAIQHEGDDLDGSHDGEIVRIHLKQVASNIQRIVFAVVIYRAVERHEHFGNVSHAFIRLTGEGHGVIDEHKIAGNFAKFTGVVIGEVYRTSDHWEFHSIDKGYYGGLQEIGQLYGVPFRDSAPG